jgi:hypothetical protein
MYAVAAVARADANDGSALLLQLSARASRASFVLLSPEAAFLWRSLEGGCCLAEAIRAVACHYGIDARQVRADMTAIVEQLRAEGFLSARQQRPDRCLGRMPREPARVRLSPPGDARPPWRDKAAMVIGFTAALIILHALPLNAVLAVMRGARRLRRQAPTVDSTTHLVACAARLARRYPGKADCLEISVAAFITGALLGKAPGWRLGVAFRPLWRHAWVETGDTAIDHAPQHPGRAYQPMLST